MIVGRADENRVVELGMPPRLAPCGSGDTVLFELAGINLERLRPEVEDFQVLEEVPTFRNDVGGLDDQIEQITDAVELPFVHQGLFSEYDLPAPKGILLYGPPGCGKTLTKAAATTCCQEVSGDHEAWSYFLNIKGPELLNKYVGETERRFGSSSSVHAEERAGLAGHRLLRRDGIL